MILTPEQFDALEAWISDMIHPEGNDLRASYIHARALLVEPEPVSSGCELCDRGMSVSTAWGGRKHVSGTKTKGQHFTDCTAP